MLLKLFFLITAFISLNLSCVTNEDCWTNGVCSQGKCLCDQGWKGDTCIYLDLTPAPLVGAYGYSPNVTSWGGVPILVGNTYHLYVAEMVNGCGLCTWVSNSRVVHAVSQTLFGPYTFTDQALPVWSHNPEIAFDPTGPTYLLFHIGDASGGNPRNCNKSSERPIKLTAPGAPLHVSSSLGGPWTPVNPPGFPNCNNPAPYVLPNGTIYLVCTWSIYVAPSWKGPWKALPFQFRGDGGKGTWEDPFIWRDSRGVWKLLSHVYISTGVHYADRVAGFAYSYDAMNWFMSSTPPFDNKVMLQDGKELVLTTRERPKLFFGDGGKILALFNGAASVVGGDKDTCGVDWTYTLVQPVG